MIEVRKTDEFETWLSSLNDHVALAKILTRIEHLALGNTQNLREVAEGVSEMRIAYGPEYRVYYRQMGKEVVMLLCGATKATQEQGVKRAKRIAAELKKESGNE